MKSFISRLVASVVLFQLPAAAAFDFASDVAPIFQRHCVNCHNEG